MTGLTGGATLFLAYLLLPGAIALLLVRGQWPYVLRAFLIWFVLLGGFFLVTAGNMPDVLYGTLVYGMFFTVLAVPFLSVLLRFLDWLKQMKVALTAD